MTTQALDTVERVARALHAIEDSWNDHAWEHVPPDTQAAFVAQAQAALEASHHAELVEALKASRCALHGVLLDRVDAALAKIGGDA